MKSMLLLLFCFFALAITIKPSFGQAVMLPLPSHSKIGSTCGDLSQSPNGLVWLGNKNKQLFAFEFGASKPKLTFSLEGSAIAQPVFIRSGNRILGVLGLDNGHICIFEQNGKIISQDLVSKDGGFTLAPLATSSDTITLIDSNSQVFCISSTGQDLHHLYKWVSATPTTEMVQLSNGNLVFGAYDLDNQGKALNRIQILYPDGKYKLLPLSRMAVVNPSVQRQSGKEVVVFFLPTETLVVDSDGNLIDSSPQTQWLPVCTGISLLDHLYCGYRNKSAKKQGLLRIDGTNVVQLTDNLPLQSSEFAVSLKEVHLKGRFLAGYEDHSLKLLNCTGAVELQYSHPNIFSIYGKPLVTEQGVMFCANIDEEDDVVMSVSWSEFK